VKVPEVCDKAAAQRALDYLKDWLSEFPFASEVDRSAALAALLTAALRVSLDLAPGFVISKPDFSVGASHAVRPDQCDSYGTARCGDQRRTKAGKRSIRRWIRISEPQSPACA